MCLNFSIETKIKPLFLISYFSLSKKRMALWVHGLYISQMIAKIIPISTRVVISCSMKSGIPFWIWSKFNESCDNNMIWISQWTGSHCRTNTRVWRNKSVKKSRTVKVTVRDESRKVNHLSRTVWDRRIITEFTWSISSSRIL